MLELLITTAGASALFGLFAAVALAAPAAAGARFARGPAALGLAVALALQTAGLAALAAGSHADMSISRWEYSGAGRQLLAAVSLGTALLGVVLLLAARRDGRGSAFLGAYVVAGAACALQVAAWLALSIGR